MSDEAQSSRLTKRDDRKELKSVQKISSRQFAGNSLNVLIYYLMGLRF